MLSEFEIIEKIFAPLAENCAGAFQLTDDAACLQPAVDHDLILTTDTLIADIHFFADDPAHSIGHKALGVNLSDLAAKGASPVGYLLSLTLPKTIDEMWLHDFAQGLLDLQNKTNCHLMGGDTVSTPGPLSISITAFGNVPKHKMVKRNGAQPTDRIYVTGTIGDAALGLHLRQNSAFVKNLQLSNEHYSFLLDRYLKPQPRIALSPILLSFASAAMDISDGLTGDLIKLCTVSDVGALLEFEKIPLSLAAKQSVQNKSDLWDTLLSGGDDYELLFCIPLQKTAEFERNLKSLDLPVTYVGDIKSKEHTVKGLRADQHIVPLTPSGYDHFK